MLQLTAVLSVQNPAEMMQQWRAQHVAEQDLGHLDRVDGSIFATELNDMEIDQHRGQDVVTHRKQRSAEAKDKTRGVLLDGLRSGELERVVDKMDADQSLAEAEAAEKTRLKRLEATKEAEKKQQEEGKGGAGKKKKKKKGKGTANGSLREKDLAGDAPLQKQGSQDLEPGGDGAGTGFENPLATDA